MILKMPKGISRGKAKSGLISYDVDSLANRFGVLYPEFKDDIKQNIVDYGDFLPETFFKEVGTPKVLDVIKNGTAADRKKLFKMLNEVYEDGTNEVQDIIGVSILGEMKNLKSTPRRYTCNLIRLSTPTVKNARETISPHAADMLPISTSRSRYRSKSSSQSTM